MTRLLVSERDLRDGLLPPFSLVSGLPAERKVQVEMTWYRWWPFLAALVPVVGFPIAMTLRHATRWRITALLPVRVDEFRSGEVEQRRRIRRLTLAWGVSTVIF